MPAGEESGDRFPRRLKAALRLELARELALTLLRPACYKSTFCDRGCAGQESACLLRSRRKSTDAAKLSNPFQVLQWKRVRNSGNALPGAPVRSVWSCCVPECGS